MHSRAQTRPLSSTRGSDAAWRISPLRNGHAPCGGRGSTAVAAPKGLPYPCSPHPLSHEKQLDPEVVADLSRPPTALLTATCRQHTAPGAIDELEPNWLRDGFRDACSHPSPSSSAHVPDWHHRHQCLSAPCRAIIVLSDPLRPPSPGCIVFAASLLQLPPPLGRLQELGT